MSPSIATNLSLVTAEGERIRPSRDDERFPFLIVTRGATAFHQRPLDGDPFLIGSGTECHLRLERGTREFPAVHSRISVSAGQLIWKLDAAGPPLIVDGEFKSTHVLREGDRVGIDGFEFAVEFLGASDIVPVDRADRAFLRMLPDCGRSVDELSATELIDGIVETNAAVEAYESRQCTGAAALLHAVRQRQLELREETEVPEEASVSDGYASLAATIDRARLKLRAAERMTDGASVPRVADARRAA